MVSEESKENVKQFMVTLKDRFGGSESKIPLGLTKPQLDAFALASNLSERYEGMIVPSMWDGWKRMVLARALPAKMFKAAVDTNLRTWLELMESLQYSNDSAAQSAFGSRVLCPDSLSFMSGSGLEVRLLLIEFLLFSVFQLLVVLIECFAIRVRRKAVW